MTETAKCDSSIGAGILGLTMRCGYFLSYYLASLVGRKRPLLGGIKLTHECNLACIHCPYHRRHKESLSFQQAISSLKALHQRGVRIIIIEGGEPFLW